MSRWGVTQVEALAPDAASVTAARKLAVAAGWSGEGCTATAAWGLAKGSGKQAYRTVVDLTGPAYSCSCPSRKFPCKHALGLLLRWAEGRVPDDEELPEHADQWLAARRTRAEARAEKPTRERTGPVDTEAAAKRAAQRAERVASGMDELDRWLTDQVRNGLAGLPAQGYPHWDAIAARMVDAQAPGVARRLRDLAGVPVSGPAWPERLLAELALLRLLIAAHRQLPELDSADSTLAAVVRDRVGYPVAKDSVLATDPVADIWSVDAVRDEDLDPSLRSRTVWLRGRLGRAAVVVSFAAMGAPLDATLIPGRAIDADVHFYPNGNRALVGARRTETAAVPPEPVDTAQALDRVAFRLAADPWCRSLPVWVDTVPARRGQDWVYADRSGAALPARPRAAAPWLGCALSGGEPIPTLLEWGPLGWRPLAYWTPTGPVAA